MKSCMSGWLRWPGRARGAAFAVAMLALSGCQGMGGGSGFDFRTAAPETPEAMGEGAITAALILPTSAEGNAGATAQAMRNAVALALSEMPSAELRVVPYDSRGGAEAAARQAVSEGASLILGPLFAAEVRAAGDVARAANTPMIAFSTDANVAAEGVYLLSFLPEGDIERIIGYAVRNGKRSFAALLPEGSYGAVVEAAFQQAVARHNARVVTIERYGNDRGQMQAAAGRLAAVAGGDSPQVDALLVPDAPNALAELAPMLASAGIRPQRVQVLGSGQWNDETAWQIAGLDGGWFAGPEPSGWQAFRSKYQNRYGSPPPRNATLAYDAASLAAALSRLEGESGFTARTLTNSDGFAGVDGVFRFRTNGINERGLAVLEIRDGTARIREPAPRSFGPGT
jgi:ABC-type branched-subunit amino acid transport system substrate-binding protein